ncbi:MAG: helix-turn-helix transcriptional regulator [Defluviitaleaceae bacterium]|nr:helix-turn-helix transcriptional regulator [Defluviitaleaceae bacterium]
MNTTTLVLKLLENEAMYGYRIIEELSKRSGDVFRLKTGTLYPLLHGLENDGLVTSFDEKADSQRVRKYYKITPEGRGFLNKKQAEWTEYSGAVNKVMGGAYHAFG